MTRTRNSRVKTRKRFHNPSTALKPTSQKQAPATRSHDHQTGTSQGNPEACRACGQSNWWRKNEAGAKWICGRCHPPATGLDVVYG